MYDGVSLASRIMATMMNHAAVLCIFELDYARRYWDSDEYDSDVWKVHASLTWNPVIGNDFIT